MILGGMETLLEMSSKYQTRTSFKPEKLWDIWDNKLTGLYAKCPELGMNASIILPHFMTGEERNFCLWAYEKGHGAGVFDGEDSAKRKIKQSLGL